MAAKVKVPFRLGRWPTGPMPELGPPGGLRGGLHENAPGSLFFFTPGVFFLSFFLCVCVCVLRASNLGEEPRSIWTPPPFILGFMNLDLWGVLVFLCAMLT